MSENRPYTPEQTVQANPTLHSRVSEVSTKAHSIVENTSRLVRKNIAVLAVASLGLMGVQAVAQGQENQNTLYVPLVQNGEELPGQSNFSRLQLPEGVSLSPSPVQPQATPEAPLKASSDSEEEKPDEIDQSPYKEISVSLEQLTSDPKIIVSKESTFDDEGNLTGSYLIRMLDENSQDLYGLYSQTITNNVASEYKAELRFEAFDPEIAINRSSGREKIFISAYTQDFKPYMLELTKDQTTNKWLQQEITIPEDIYSFIEIETLKDEQGKDTNYMIINASAAQIVLYDTNTKKFNVIDQEKDLQSQTYGDYNMKFGRLNNNTNTFDIYRSVYPNENDIDQISVVRWNVNDKSHEETILQLPGFDTSMLEYSYIEPGTQYLFFRQYHADEFVAVSIGDENGTPKVINTEVIDYQSIIPEYPGSRLSANGVYMQKVENKYVTVVAGSVYNTSNGIPLMGVSMRVAGTPNINDQTPFIQYRINAIGDSQISGKDISIGKLNQSLIVNTMVADTGVATIFYSGEVEPGEEQAIIEFPDMGLAQLPGEDIDPTPTPTENPTPTPTEEPTPKPTPGDELLYFPVIQNSSNASTK